MQLLVVIYFALSNIYKIDPEKYAADNKDRLHRMGFAIAVFMAATILLLSSITHPGKARNWVYDSVFAGVGLLVLPDWELHALPSKPNYFAGIRLPWTLNNEDNWRRTYHAGG